MKVKKIVLVSLLGLTACGLYKTPLSESDNIYYSEYMAIAARNPSNFINEPKLPQPDFELNDDVRKELRYFLKEDRYFILYSLNNRKKFEPMIQKIFDDYGLPKELAVVALIESKYEPKAVSRSGAVGMWQFMKTTGKNYGLSVSFFKDERRDPVLSTIAAAKHLRDLYDKYNDWYLALAAYNSGVGNVDRTIARANSDDFWEIKSNFREQTQRYVAKFVAANIILNDLDFWGFRLESDVKSEQYANNK